MNNIGVGTSDHRRRLDEYASRDGGVTEATDLALEKMKNYVKASSCHELLVDLYEKLVVEQPEDPVDFLIAVLEERIAKK